VVPDEVESRLVPASVPLGVPLSPLSPVDSPLPVLLLLLLVPILRLVLLELIAFGGRGPSVWDKSKAIRLNTPRARSSVWAISRLICVWVRVMWKARYKPPSRNEPIRVATSNSRRV
jgi:hypothetical protein